MKNTLISMVLLSLFISVGAQAKTVEIEVHGMTCSFCVDSLERKFSEMDSVSKVEVSLKQKKVRLETADTSPDLETIKKAVLDAGFTPVKVTVI